MTMHCDEVRTRVRKSNPTEENPQDSKRKRVMGLQHGAEGTRTLDPLRAKQVLSQLSYRPEVQQL